MVPSTEGLLHWSPSSSEASTSLSVELTSYVLLAVLSRPQLSATDRGYTSRIAGWLVRQQNPQGGFFSTQVRTGPFRYHLSPANSICSPQQRCDDFFVCRTRWLPSRHCPAMLPWSIAQEEPAQSQFSPPAVTCTTSQWIKPTS